MSLILTLIYKYYPVVIIILLTSILDTFMFRLNMHRQTTLLCKLLITVITSILDALMFSLCMVP